METATLHVGGLHFATEKDVVERVLARRPGVASVEANPVAQTATVRYDADLTSIAELRGWIEECGFHCAGRSVPNHICDAMQEAPSRSTAAPDHHERADSSDRVDGAVHAAHAGPASSEQSPHDAMGHGGHAGMSMDEMVRDMRNRFLVAAVLSIPILLWSRIGREVLGFTATAPLGIRDDVFQLILSLPVVFYAGWIFFDGAARALRARTLDMMVLVAVAVAAGWGYSLVITISGGEGEVFYEAASVLTAFVLLGHWFEMRARGGANDAIRKLLDLAPPTALVLRDGEPVEVPTADVVPGDLLLIRPGSRIPVDAVVEEGEGEVDESMVTGESLPVHKEPRSDLIGATINRNGTFRARASRVGADTALAQIVKLVQEAQNSKAPGQRLADRAAFWLVLVALVGGAGTFAAWMLAGRPTSEAILFAITVVVVTCPDALGLATPTAIMVGTGLGADRGILFKNAMALEASARIDIVVMDKTGTLTKGEPEVTDVVTHDLPEQELLRLAAAVEQDSEHPLAAAVVRRAEASGATVARAERFENVPGHGAIAWVEGRQVVIGNRRLMERERIDLSPVEDERSRLASGGRTTVIVAVDGKPVGSIGIADAVRETAAASVAALKELGVEVVMLTGDNPATAERIAGILGVDTVIADVLPADKAGKVTEVRLRECRGGRWRWWATA